MKFLKITAAILSLSFLTACNSGRSVQTSETVSESEASSVTAAAETTAETEAETETETSAITTTANETVPAEDEIAFDDELVSALADIIEMERRNDRNFFMYDFNRDGCPEIAFFYGFDTDCSVYDFSSGEAVSMGIMLTGECSENPDINCCCELYFDENSGEYIYVSLPRFSESVDALTDYYIQNSYRTKVSSDMKFNCVDNNNNFYWGNSKEEWYAARESAWESLSGYTLIEHIKPDNFKTYTVYDPSPYDPSPRELAVTVLKDYHMGE